MTALLAGLGNPGREYDLTRHNAGFMIADRLARRLGVEFSAERKFEGHVARAGDILLLKPQTFMNLSGRSVAAACRYFRIPVDRILVMVDDVSLPLGRLRLRAGGSSGGHNGLRSVAECLGTGQFPRLRFGVGGPGGRSLTGHVLGRFAEAERDDLDKLLEKAADAAMMAALRGLPAAMNEFNRDPAPPAAGAVPAPTTPPTTDNSR